MPTKIMEDFLEKMHGNERLPEGAALREKYALLRVIFNQADHLMGLLKPDGTVIKINPTAYGFIKGKESGVIGKFFWETPWWTHSPEQQKQLREAIEVAAQGEFVRFEATHATPKGNLIYVDFSLKPVKDEKGNVVLLVPEGRDITERKRAEEKSLRLATIVESSDDAIVGKTVDGLITSWNRGAEKIFGYSEDEVLGQPIMMLVPSAYADEVRQTQERIRRGEHIEHFETVRRRKDGELIHMSLTYSPIKDEQGRIVAVSTIGRDITEQQKSARALLDNARINRELEIAKEIQQSFLPACPRELSGMLTACRCVPATYVGGDYYDFFSLPGGIVDVVIADVTGHSVGASLLMTMTRSVLHAKVNTSRSPGKLLAAVNDLLHDDLAKAELQITMFYVRFDTENRTLAYANAGHNPPLLFRAQQGVFTELDAEGLLMGVKTDVRFEEKITRLEAGDILILYTDGVTEAENADDELFGSKRLREVIAEHCDRHPEQILVAIFEKLAAFTDTRSLLDDVAMIIFKTV